MSGGEPFAEADAALRDERRLRDRAARLRLSSRAAETGELVEQLHRCAAHRRALARWCVVAVAGPGGRTAGDREAVARAINEERDRLGLEPDDGPLGDYRVG
ncbi:MAG: hypothetical protein ACRC33_21355, partial [Gemmataceae bacterium]